MSMEMSKANSKGIGSLPTYVTKLCDTNKCVALRSINPNVNPKNRYHNCNHIWSHQSFLQCHGEDSASSL